MHTANKIYIILKGPSPASVEVHSEHSKPPQDTAAEI